MPIHFDKMLERVLVYWAIHFSSCIFHWFSWSSVFQNIDKSVRCKSKFGPPISEVFLISTIYGISVTVLMLYIISKVMGQDKVVARLVQLCSLNKYRSCDIHLLTEPKFPIYSLAQGGLCAPVTTSSSSLVFLNACCTGGMHCCIGVIQLLRYIYYHGTSRSVYLQLMRWCTFICVISHTTRRFSRRAPHSLAMYDVYMLCL